MAGMGVGEAAALLIAAGGTYASMSAQQEQADDQRRVLNRQLESTEKAGKQVNDLVLDEAQNFNPVVRSAALDAAANEAAGRTASDLEGAGGTLATVNTAGDAGNVSKDFLTAKADRAVSEGTRLTDLGRELAKIRAPGMVTKDDALRSGNLGSNISDILGSNARMAQANTLDAQAVQAPGYGALGSLASAIGTAYAGGQIAKGAGAASAGTGLTAGSTGVGMRAPASVFNWKG